MIEESCNSVRTVRMNVQPLNTVFLGIIKIVHYPSILDRDCPITR